MKDDKKRDSVEPDLTPVTETDLAIAGIEELTALDNYMPTPAERRLLIVLTDPDSVGLSITDLCKKAGITRQTYYTTMNKAPFVKFQKAYSMRQLEAETAPLLSALVKHAKKGNPLHMKMALEMLGLHVDKRQIDANVTEKRVVIMFEGQGEPAPAGPESKRIIIDAEVDEDDGF